MTATIEVVPDRIDQQRLAQQLVEAARAEGVELVGPDGLLTGLTKTLLETALEAEMSEHLGYDRHDPVGRDGGNSRKRHPHQDGVDRDRTGADRGSARPRRQLRPGSRCGARNYAQRARTDVNCTQLAPFRPAWSLFLQVTALRGPNWQSWSQAITHDRRSVL
jgi:Transposase, Mutator family